MDSTTDLIRQAGLTAVVAALLLTLVVVVLRLLALPLAVGAMVLDRSATLAARPLTFTAPVDGTLRR